MGFFDFISKYITTPARSVANFLGSNTAQSLGNGAVNFLSDTGLINQQEADTGRNVLGKIKQGAGAVNNLLDSIN